MRFRNYDELTQHIKAKAKRVPFAVVRANEAHTMEAVVQSCRDGLIEPHFIGGSAEIKAMLQGYDLNPSDFEIIDQDDPTLAAQAAVDLVHNGTVKGIMKGKLETGQLMKVLLKSDNK